jgi:hypothetical protein
MSRHRSRQYCLSMAEIPSAVGYCAQHVQVFGRQSPRSWDDLIHPRRKFRALVARSSFLSSHSDALRSGLPDAERAILSVFGQSRHTAMTEISPFTQASQFGGALSHG